jgi:hypothetical protein
MTDASISNASTQPADTTRPRHTARRSRIAAMGIGVAAMAGLVGNMEVTGSRAHAAAPPVPLPPSAADRAETAHRHMVALARLAAVSMPIVLTPHAVVHTVTAPAAPSYGGSSGGYSAGAVYAAAPHAAAPAASTGGSHP